MAATSTSLKLEPEIRDRIQKIASEKRRTPELIIRDAIGEYLDREERRKQLRQDAMAAWDDYQRTGLHLTGEEVDAWLAKLEAGEEAVLPECHV
jgi:predicted transcriptional regulator